MIPLYMGMLVSDAQSPIEKSIPLRDSSMVRTVAFEIGGVVQTIHCSVKSYLSAGELSFKMVDPEGKTEGSFWLDTITDGKNQPGSGRMTHEVQAPLAGTWKLQIRATHATGNLNYSIHFK